MSLELKREINGLVTHETNPSAIVGIWLMILTPDNKLFIVQNLKAKYASQKVPNQFNSPAETFIPEDGNFYGTIARAVREEIGELKYDPSRIVRLGINKLNVNGLRVFASPHLIRVEDESCLVYDPQDSTEACNPQWVNLSDVKPTTLKLGPYEVPRFRTPMLENVQMLKNYLDGDKTRQVIHSQVTPIPPEVYSFLENNFGSNGLPH